MLSLSSFSAISFDFWQTLASSNPEYASHRTTFLKMFSSLETDEVKRIAKNLKQELDDNAEKEGIGWSTEACVHELLKRLNPELDSIPRHTIGALTEVLQSLALTYPPIISTETIKVLNDLKQKGFQIGIISNTNFISGSTLRQVLSRLGIEFDLYVFSDEVLCSKPNPKIFDRFSKLSTVEPARILHIGDNATNDVFGALSSGFKSLLVNDPKHTTETLNHLLK